MSSISETFAKLESSGKKAYIPYVCCGDPSVQFSRELVHCLVEAGADLLEIGIPFSDTLADGQAIQAASERALSKGMNVNKALDFVRSLRQEGVKIPILPMTYYNLVFHYGVERFCASFSEAGADGLIVPDLPLEESARLKNACERNGLDLIHFIAPTTSAERMQKILSAATGFVYVVAVTGVTGAREDFSGETKNLICDVKKISRIPVAVGFGISKPEHAQEAARAGADAVIEASQLVRIYSSLLGGSDDSEEIRRAEALRSIKSHALAMKSALKN